MTGCSVRYDIHVHRGDGDLNCITVVDQRASLFMQRFLEYSSAFEATNGFCVEAPSLTQQQAPVIAHRVTLTPVIGLSAARRQSPVHPSAHDQYAKIHSSTCTCRVHIEREEPSPSQMKFKPQQCTVSCYVFTSLVFKCVNKQLALFFHVSPSFIPLVYS